MEFRFEDILKNIIPGMVFLIAIMILFFNQYNYPDFKEIFSSYLKEYSEIILVFILVGSYISGHLLDSFSSLLEYYIIYRIWGAPSLRLLKGKGSRIHLVNHDKVLQNINKQCFSQADTISFTGNLKKDKKLSRELFKQANYLKDLNPNADALKKINDYYYSYIFARNLAFSYLILFIVVMGSFLKLLTYPTIIVSTFFLIALFARRRDRAYYYSRQVLLASNFN